MRHQRFGSSAEEQRKFVKQRTGFIGKLGFSQTLIAGIVLPVDKVYSGKFHAFRKTHCKRLICAGKITERFFNMHMQRIADNFARREPDNNAARTGIPPEMPSSEMQGRNSSMRASSSAEMSLPL